MEFDYISFAFYLEMYMKSYKAVILIVANRFLYLYLIYSRRNVSIFELDAHICTDFTAKPERKTCIFSTGASERSK